MYSVILMAALTTGAEAPACGHGWSSCHGCYSSSYGCHGCSGCYGCHGYSGCHGCYGCSGYYGCSGCYGGYGGCYGAWYGYGSYSCQGYWGCYGAPVVPSIAPIAAPMGDKVPEKKPSTDLGNPNRAKLIVEVPADAKLYIDDQLMKTTASVRTFNTPVLEKGEAYYYIVRAEVVRDGKVVAQTKQVIIRAGEEVRTLFNESDIIKAAKADKPLSEPFKIAGTTQR